MRNVKLYGSRVLAALLLSLCLVLPACAGEGPGSDDRGAAPPERSQVAEPDRTEAARGGKTAAEETRDEATGDGGTTVEAVLPEDVLSEEELQQVEVPQAKDFFEPSGAEPIQIEGGGSAGSIPAVKPFNFGRDPGGPEDKTLYLTVPKLGLYDVPIIDEVSEEALEKGAAHIPATGYPWQEGANVYIAGHRIGYPGTRSDRVFYDLDQLVPGDEVFLYDSAGGEYVYSVIEESKVVPPDNVEVMNPVPGRSIVSLQTCTLPDYAERVVVQAELV